MVHLTARIQHEREIVVRQLGRREEFDSAYHLLNKLSIVGIDLNTITQQLEDEGVEKFITAYDQLMALLKAKTTALHALHGG